MTEKGKILMADPKSFAMFPNGTGDFLSAMNEKKTLETLRTLNIEYLSVCHSNNLTDSMIDTIALGYIISNKLDIVAKCTAV